MQAEFNHFMTGVYWPARLWFNPTTVLAQAIDQLRLSGKMMLLGLPTSGRWTVFLDVDGTLLDIAPTPHAVRVPEGLVATLTRLRENLDEALAFVSGRSLDEIDQLFAPLRTTVAAEHGAILRLPDGNIEEADVAIPVEWRATLADLAQKHRGILIEEKRHSIVVHFRLAPEAEPLARHAVDALVADAADRFDVLPARMAFEIRGRGVSKATALKRLMQTSLFAGRRPLYIGDDVTDEPAIAAARELGGLGLHVGRDFGGEPANVRSWIGTLIDEAPIETPPDTGENG
jgi:trehalose 6-phosphate phosphatase